MGSDKCAIMHNVHYFKYTKDTDAAVKLKPIKHNNREQSLYLWCCSV